MNSCGRFIMNKKKLYQDFYEAIKNSYKNYLIYGDRSEEKIKPLHKFLGEAIKSLIGDKYEVYFLNGKEVQTEGKYYTKIIDIAIVEKGKEVKEVRIGPKKVFYIPEILMAISVKFITSNFRQNANNYFENLLGECANLRSKGIKFAHFVVFRDKIPYFERNGKIKTWEQIEDKDIEKYIKLFEEMEKSFHAPDVIGIEIVNINPIIEEQKSRKPPFRGIKGEIQKIKIQNGISNLRISKEIKGFISNNFNLYHFLEEVKRNLIG